MGDTCCTNGRVYCAVHLYAVHVVVSTAVPPLCLSTCGAPLSGGGMAMLVAGGGGCCEATRGVRAADVCGNESEGSEGGRA